MKQAKLDVFVRSPQIELRRPFSPPSSADATRRRIFLLSDSEEEESALLDDKPMEVEEEVEEDFGADADAIRGELFGSDGEEEFVKWVGGDARLPVRDIFCSCFSFHDSTAKMRSIELLAPGTWQRRAAENE